ncbi:ABC-type nitrate/sulfonate/bicarbonate transport system, substrate-binding protein [Asanoa hainanensis]|uniref:Thiamine pyrimidine synthase n=1 Tax=Asanoa hainanensis TaxID=560556 RepID=A0A239N024_9ACTN|nr:ABC-type nitrate/sulfonate/bicarbonate transport system, substrate-binding protein [Asanoa hainanensis]
MTSRRDFLSVTAKLLGGGALMAVSGGALAACGDDDDAKSASGGVSPVTFQLGWLANVENMGIYVADDGGYYTKEGLKTTVVPGGPSVSVGPLVASGKAFVGLDSVDTIARARKEGAPLKIVGATLQKNPSAVVSLAKSPIRTPQDLVGKRLGVQQSGTEIYNAFFKANGVDPKSVTYVPVQFDPAPLVNGEVDAFASFLTSQPIQLKRQGVDTEAFLLADFGYGLWADAFVVSEATLADKEQRARLVNLMRASVKGWQDAVADPAKGVKLAVEKYGKSLQLNADEQLLTAQSFVPLIQTPETKTNGLLTMSKAGIDANIATMAAVGITATADELFDTTILADVFAGKPTV